jgi:hypothetical protein
MIKQCKVKNKKMIVQIFFLKKSVNYCFGKQSTAFFVRNAVLLIILFI